MNASKSQWRKFEWYDKPHYYDIVFDGGTRKEANFIEALFTKYVRSNGLKILEPACGSGRLIAELVRRGYSVSGFDQNEKMLRYARVRLRKQGLKAKLKIANFESFSFGRQQFDLAFCLVSSIKHIQDKKRACKHLRLMADALRPGGVYVIGLHLTDYTETEPFIEELIEKRDGIGVYCKLRTSPPNEKKRTEKWRCRLIVHERETVTRYESNWLARTYSAGQLRKLIHSERRFKLVDCYSFDYNINKPILLGKKRMDNVLILRRRK